MRIASLTLVTMLSLTGNAFELNPKESAEMFVNSDGTVSIQNPRLKSSYGWEGDKDYWVSSASSMDGVCKMFGFGAALPSSVVSSSLVEDVIHVYDGGIAIDLKRGRGLKSLSCELSNMVMEKSMRLGQADSATFLNLRLHNDRFIRRISFNSDILGLCHRLGYEAFSAASAGDGTQDNLHFVTGDKGQIVGLEKGPFIEAITCRIRR